MSAIEHPGALFPSKGLARAAVVLEMERRGTEGYIGFNYRGKKFYTWYQSVGDYRRSPCRPLVVLHGGPGLTSSYMSTLAGLRATHGIPVIFYDQLGCGRSTLPQSSLDAQDSSFWSLGLFLAELDNVLRYMGLRDSDKRGFDLLGHGFGGVIAAEYATTFQPCGLRRLVLSSTPASSDLWQQSRSRSLEQLPTDVGNILRMLEKVDHTHSEEYQRTMMTYMRKQICTLDPWPRILTDSLNNASNSPAHRALLGPKYFTFDGLLKTWSIVGRVRSIKKSTLMLNGASDEVRDECLQPFFEGLERVNWIRMTKSSHMPHLEETELYLLIVGDFLNLSDDSEANF